MERLVKVADFYPVELINNFASHGVRFIVQDGKLYEIRGKEDKDNAKKDR